MSAAKKKPEALARVIPLQQPERVEQGPQPHDPAVGKWYWMNVKAYDDENDASDYGEGERVEKLQLLCVVHIGTNFAELKNVRGTSWRVHFNDFEKWCKWEPDAKRIIEERVTRYRTNAGLLMDKVNEVTRALGVGMGTTALEAGSDTAALAVIGGESKEQSDKRIKDYKKALVKAEEKTLPELFEQVKKQNKLMARWMKAELLPLEAELEKLKPLQEAIKARVFNVELYAGLVEEVKQVKEGAPAPITEKLHLFQRRLYMDEECLANYEAGGLNFQHLDDFDAWMAKPVNMKRLLPYQRSIVAFRIRHHDKKYEAENWRDFMKLAFEKSEYQKEDKRTFLYIRNGEQLWRLETGIEFGENLFPSTHVQEGFTGQLYAREVPFGTRRRDDREWEVITQWDLEQRRSDLARQMMEYRKALREYPAKFAAARDEFERTTWAQRKHEWFEYVERMQEHGHKRNDKYLRTPVERFGEGCYSDAPRWADVRIGYDYDKKDGAPLVPEKPTKPSNSLVKGWRKWNRGDVYWDDIAKDLKKQMDEYNRIVLVLQGLFDRSTCLHPHPPVKLYEGESFKQALTLIYDERSIVSGPPVDFEEYRAQLNKSLKVGSIVTGQEQFWLMDEAEKYNAKHQHEENHFDKSGYRPPGNPGPGRLARIVRIRGGKARFEWLRKRQPKGYVSWHRREEWAREQQVPIECSIEVPLDALFNVDAYTPGDYHLFFDDPRTRELYLKWAPFLLTAEDYHGGKLEVQDAQKAFDAQPDRDY